MHIFILCYDCDGCYMAVYICSKLIGLHSQNCCILMYVNYVRVKLIPLKHKIHTRIYDMRPSVLKKRKEKETISNIWTHTFLLEWARKVSGSTRIKILAWIASAIRDGVSEGVWWGRDSSFCTFQILNHANN